MNQLATFGAGCFWHVQASFDAVPGVCKTTVGYMGGAMKKPSYEQVCSGATEHVEVCQVEFSGSYDILLKTFWSIHNPTQGNRQGPDKGTQYRSVIFVHSEEQRQKAEHSLREEQKKYRKNITTSIEPASTFYPAEEYHQNYFKKHGKVC